MSTLRCRGRATSLRCVGLLDLLDHASLAGMTDTKRPGPHLSTYETDLLRMLDEADRGLDPCTPVPWAHYEQLMRALLRKGLVTDYYWSNRPVTDETPLMTDAGRAWLRFRWPLEARLPRSCFHGCGRGPGDFRADRRP